MHSHGHLARRGVGGTELGGLVLVLVVSLLAVASASAAPNTDLTDPDVRLSDNFYPCPLALSNGNNPPQVEDCFDAFGPVWMPAGGYGCQPDDTSFVDTFQRTQGSAFIPGAPGGGWLNGWVTWALSATIGPQTGPAMPTVFPFPGGAPVESHGLPTGAVTSFEGTFTIDPFDGSPDISGTVSLTPNDGNWGVCRQFFDQPSGSPNIGGGVAPVTGDVLALNAGVLTYEVTDGPAALIGETGVAESYLMNSFVWCCNAVDPDHVNIATGHFRLQFGTTHPAEGTSGSAATPTGTNVTVANFQGLDEDVGGVEVTFSGVSSAGETNATLMTSAPELPAGFQVGDPPAFYEISTTAEVTPPITVCLRYGSLPAGTEAALLHYENGAWVDITTSDSGPPDNEVCGQASSLSPFAAVFAPLSATEKIGEALSTLASLRTARNADKLEDVVEKLDKALGKLALSPADRQGAVGELEGAVGDVQSAVGSRLLMSADGNAVMTTIAEAARLLAEEAIADAAGGNSAKLTEAGAALTAGNARLASGRFKDAVAKYKDAVSKAEGA